jgi:hypothetical protein
LYIKSIGLGRGTPDSSYKEKKNLKKYCLFLSD